LLQQFPLQVQGGRGRRLRCPRGGAIRAL